MALWDMEGEGREKKDNAFLGKRKRGSEALGCVVHNVRLHWMHRGLCSNLVSHYHHVLNYKSGLRRRDSYSKCTGLFQYEVATLR
jgi:hypothetical protein